MVMLGRLSSVGLRKLVPIPFAPSPAETSTVPGAGTRPPIVTGLMVVIGCASEMTAMSFGAKATFPGKFEFRTKLVMAVPGPAMGANDMETLSFGAKQ